MTMKLDRQLQLAILEYLSTRYPSRVNDLYDSIGEEFDDAAVFHANVAYLEELGLIKATWQNSVELHLIFATITARGMDFLADDGGLTAILGVVTVKLHEDTLRALITQKIEQADMPEPEKKRLLDQIRDLQPEAIKHLTMKLLDQGLESSGKVMGLIAGMLT